MKFRGISSGATAVGLDINDEAIFNTEVDGGSGLSSIVKKDDGSESESESVRVVLFVLLLRLVSFL